jgi:hypothetical protein
MRWRIERDYQELRQQEVGLVHFEGRGWRGFHHHANFASQPTDSANPLLIFDRRATWQNM